MEWQDIDATLRVIILLGAAVGSLTGIVMFLNKLNTWLKRKYEMVEWIFSEEHAHQEIKTALTSIGGELKEIKSELTENGGSGTLKDAVCDIRGILAFNSRYMRVLNHSKKEATFETDSKGSVTEINKAFTRLTQYSANEVLGFGWKNLIYQPDRENVVRMWTEAVESGIDFNEVIRYQYPDGTPYTVHAMAHAIKVHGQLLGHYGEIIPLEDT